MVKRLERFRTWTENPHAGGSMPPLATIQNRLTALAASALGPVLL